VLIGLARAAKDPNKLTLAPELFTYEPYALMVRRNERRLPAGRQSSRRQLYRAG
jgi:hypothetical protein